MNLRITATPSEIALMNREEKRSYRAKRKFERAIRKLIAAERAFSRAKSGVRIEFTGLDIDERKAVVKTLLGADVSGTRIDEVIDLIVY
jgi:hypothetical protein